MRMRLIGLALAGCVVAVPAHANEGLYIGAEAGAAFFGNEEIDVDQADKAMAITTNAGWDYGAYIGYDLGSFRLEAEATRKTAKMQQLRGNGGFDVDETSAGTQELASVDGDIQVDSIMVNALVDLGSEGGVALYGGGGIGYAWTEANGKIAGVLPQFVDDKAKGFAWQLVAGVGVPVVEGIELGARYRYLNVTGLEMMSPGGRDFEASYSAHSLVGTLVFSFGGS